MKINVSLYRVVVVKTDHLIANLNANISVEEYVKNPNKIEVDLKNRFGVLAPRFKIWVQSKTKSIAGIETMSSSIPVENVPQAGIINCDPVIPSEIDRIDGALRSELERMGISTDIEQYDWRWIYIVS